MFGLGKKRRTAEKIDQEKLLEKVNNEVAEHQEQQEKVTKTAVNETQKLNRRIIHNGFTIRIHLAAGGRNHGG